MFVFRKKGTFFKLVCLSVLVSFSSACITVSKGRLISTEDNIISNEYFKYTIKRVKNPTLLDPTVDYKIMKIPLNAVVRKEYYEMVRKYYPKASWPFGLVGGAIVGLHIGQILPLEEEEQRTGAELIGILLGGIIGTALPLLIKIPTKTVGQTKEHHLIFNPKPDAEPIPARNIQVEIQWPERKGEIYIAKADDLGLLRINLVNDLKPKKFPPDKPSRLLIKYINTETGKLEMHIDNLELIK